MPDEIVTAEKPEVSPAAERLRAFEDERLGKDIHRIDDKVERGHGSLYQTKLTDKDRAHHAALERLVAAEEKLATAKAATAIAQAEAEAAYAAAEEAVEKAPPESAPDADK